MADYVIMSDSSCDFSPEMVEELGVVIQPLTFRIEEEDYLNYPDNREMDPHEFYEKLRGGVMGSTSAVNPQTFMDTMTPLVEQGKDVLYLAFSSGLSTTYQSACIAAEEVMSAHPGSRIVVVDTRAASMGQGLLVFLAVQEKNKGRSLDEVAAYAEDIRDRVCHWFTVDDLHHLKRGGRVSAAAAVVGTMLQMKPVLHVDDEGHLIPMSKVRGRKASLAALLEKMEELEADPELVFISHGDCKEDAEHLAAMIREKFPVKRLEISFIGPVIGNHSGPGTVALFFVGKHK